MLDEVNSAKYAFEISKWHKSKGQFRTPPLVDPLHPEKETAHTLEDKRDILMRNILCNQTDIEDISHHIPTVAPCSLPFLQITDEEISDAILRAGSTTSGKDRISTALHRLA